MQDLVMNDEQRLQYTVDRKLHRDKETEEKQRATLREIVIHNGYRTDEVRDSILEFGTPFIEYQPRKSTETHFFEEIPGRLHAVNARGVTRLVRDHDQAKVLQELVNHDITVRVRNYGGNEYTASSRFVAFAHDLVDGLSDELRANHREHLFVIFGPHSSLHVDTLQEECNDFLNYKIAAVGTRRVISFDYVFADQAYNVLAKLYALANVTRPGMDVHTFHYGKIGLLKRDATIGAIGIPDASIEEEDIARGELRVKPIHNELAERLYERFRRLVREKLSIGVTVNTCSVLQQTKQRLERALAVNGSWLDMEWAVMASLQHGYRSKYPNIGRIHHYFSGVGSDIPLAGKTLATTVYPQPKEQVIARAYLQLIQEL